MKRISILVLIPCASFVSVAWDQHPGCEFSPLSLVELHRPRRELLTRRGEW